MNLYQPQLSLKCVQTVRVKTFVLPQPATIATVVCTVYVRVKTSIASTLPELLQQGYLKLAQPAS